MSAKAEREEHHVATAVSEDQALLIDAIRKFARNELLEADRRWDKDETSVWEMLPAVAEMGLLSLSLPEEYGGLDCDMRTYAAIIRELAYASPSTAVSVSVHSMVAKVLGMHATDAWKEKFYGELGSHEHFAAFAISEADAGSDVSSAQAVGQKVDGGYRITGSKMWITNGQHARWFLVLCRTNPDIPRSGGLSAMIVDGNEPGIERDKIHGKMGIRGSETVVLHLNDVFVPDENLLGNEGDGMKVCLGALDEGRIGIASQAAGIAEACLDEMVSYANERTQFDRPIGQFQAIQTMVADSSMELEAAKLLIDRAAHLIDQDQKDPKASAMAKLYATESANRIAYRAVQVHGGTGYVNECRVEQLYRDVRVTTIYEGTSEVQRIVIARQLIKED